MSTAKPVKRACDQCHSLKEKCRRPDLGTSCERCDRLGQICQTTRAAAKTGRKPRVSRELSYSLPSAAGSNIATASIQSTGAQELASSSVSRDAGLTSNSAIFSDLDNWERHFLNLMKNPASPSPLAKYLVGSSFFESHHSSFIQYLIQPSPALRNATVACAAALFGDQDTDSARKGLQVGHQRAALAVASLRSLEIASEQDVVTAIILGVALTTFAMHVANGQSMLILRYVLRLVQLHCPELSVLDPSLVDFLMCLVCAETFECLLQSQLPTLRVNLHDRPRFVDRYLGLSSPIFSYFYEICDVSILLRCANKADDPALVERLKQLKRAVEQWRPLAPEDFSERFASVEVAVILAQATVLRLTGLLIIHRLRFPFGQRDDEAFVYSNEIITGFEKALRLHNRSLPCTSIGYFAACAEMMDPEARARELERSTQVVTFSKQAQIRLKDALGSVWRARDSGHSFYWFELREYIQVPRAE